MVSTTECGFEGDDETKSSINYCQWQYYTNTNYYDWNCGSGIFCEAFADNKCIYLNSTFTKTYCDDDIIDTDNFNFYLKCCDASSTDNCNYQDILLNDCTQSTDYEQYYSLIYECMYGNTSVYQQYLCDDTITELTCDGIYNLNKAKIDCDCTGYKFIYDRISQSSKILLQNKINQVFNGQFDSWNKVLGCDITISCDVSTGITKGSNGIVAKTTQEPISTDVVSTQIAKGGNGSVATTTQEPEISEVVSTDSAQGLSRFEDVVVGIIIMIFIAK